MTTFKKNLETYTDRIIRIYGFENWRTILFCRICDIFGVE